MDDSDDETQPAVPQAWVTALESARADVAAGRTSSWPEVRARLVAELAALEAAKARRKA